MRLLVIAHRDFFHLGLVADIASADDELVIHEAHSDPAVPSIEGFDALVVMGGPQHAWTETDFPSRAAELQLIRAAAERDLPTLGICLGSQLMAEALGGRAYPLSAKGIAPERGYLPVKLTDAGASDELFADCPPEFAPKQYHEDSFDMPPGAIRLATSARCSEQGFRLPGRPLWALQFHFEMKAGDPTLPWTAPRMQGNAPFPERLDDATLAAIDALHPVATQIFANFRTAVLQSIEATGALAATAQ